jgi:predicted nucleic acid-binding protein
MIIADTGFWLALANRKDKYHQLATNKLNIAKNTIS